MSRTSMTSAGNPTNTPAPISVDTLVCGATFYGLGYAVACEESVMVVDRTGNVGREFAAAFRAGSQWQADLGSKVGRSLSRDLLQRNILSDGRVHLPALVPVLASVCVAHGLPVALLTEIVSLRRDGSGFEVTLLDAAGTRTVHARRIIDTTSTCDTRARTRKRVAGPPDVEYGVAVGPTDKGLGASLHVPPSEAEGRKQRFVLPIEGPDGGTVAVSITQGRFPGEAFASLTVPLDSSWSEARRYFHDVWDRRPESYLNWTIAGTGFAFQYEFATERVEIEPYWEWIPSEQHDNALSAFDAGAIHANSGAQETGASSGSTGTTRPAAPDAARSAQPDRTVIDSPDPAYDVVVVGLGTAGSVAALAAAKRGVRVLGVERETCLGGSATGGAVLGYYFGSHGGLYEEIDELTRQIATSGRLTASRSIKPAEAKKLALETALRDADVRTEMETTVVSVVREERRVVALRLVGPAGSYEVSASAMIDATGNGEVCALAGAPILPIGRGFDHQPQPFSNVKVTVNRDGILSNRYNDDGIVDPTDPSELAEAILTSTTHHLQEHYGQDPERLLYVAPQLGLRESRFVDGEETLTFEDYVHDRLTDEPVFWAYSNLDNHTKDLAFEGEVQQDWAIAASLWGVNFHVPVPYGAHIPQGIEGLLVAGRCLSVDHDLAGCVRQQRDMQHSGECAGVAAALSVATGAPLREIDTAELRRQLGLSGCLQSPEDPRLVETVSRLDVLNPRFEWYQDRERIKRELAGGRPGNALWSAFRLGHVIRDELAEWLDAASRPGVSSGDPQKIEHLKIHSAFALALLGDRRSLPVLRQTVTDGDDFCPASSRHDNQGRGYGAVYLLGKLRDADAVPVLTELLSDVEGYIRRVYGDPPRVRAAGGSGSNYLDDYDELQLQYSSHAIRALLRIGDAHPKTRSDVVACLSAAMADTNFRLINRLRSVSGGDNRVHYDMTNTARIVVAGVFDDWGLEHNLHSVLDEQDLTSREARLRRSPTSP